MPFPFALLGLGSLASTVATIAGVGAAAYGAKKVYDAVKDDDDDYSYSSSYTSDKSEEEINKEQNNETLQKLQKDVIDFWRRNDNLSCFDSEEDFDTYSEALSDFLSGDISVTKMKEIYREAKTDKNSALNTIDWDNDKLEEMLDYTINDFDDIVNCINYDNSSYDTYAGYKMNFDSFAYGQQVLQLASELPKLTEYVEGNSHNYIFPDKSTLPNKLKNNQALLKKLENIELAKQAESGLPRVAVCGLLKAGKSSLLNNLIHDTNNETFSVGATRETVKNKELEYNGLIFIDTPGMEANKDDTEEAWKAYTTSDLLLFVHLAELPLTKQEIEILQNIQADRQDLNKRAIMVLAQADQAGENIHALKQVISEQLENALSFDFPIFPISNTIHQKGFIKGKEKLQELSGINDLNAYLNRIKNTLLTKVSDEQKANTKKYFSELVDYVEALINENQEKINQIEQKNAELARQFKNYVLYPAQKTYHYE